MYKLITGLTAALLLLTGCNRAESNAADSAAAACFACHSGNLGFSGDDAAEIAALIREILDGDLAHPPLGIDDTSDEAIAELARQLTAE